MKKLLLLIPVFIILLLPLGVYAFTTQTGSSVYVAEDETIKGNLFAAGNNITVDGTVEGDVICGAQNLIINGTVEGDVICGAQSINIRGAVNGSVRVAGNSIILAGPVQRNVMAFGANISQEKGSSVGWDFFMAAATAELRGRTGGDLHGGGGQVILAGSVDGDVKLRLDERAREEKAGIAFDSNEPLMLPEGAMVGGNLYYTAGQEGRIDPGAAVAGEIGYSRAEKNDRARAQAMNIWGGLLSLFSALVIGLVLLSLWRPLIVRLTDRMLERAGASIGWGAVVMFLTPIAAILLMITLIGIPLALILLAFWLIALYVSKILLAILVGRSLFRRLSRDKEKEASLIWAMILGVLIVWFICGLPLIGWLFGLVALWWGLGGIWLELRNKSAS